MRHAETEEVLSRDEVLQNAMKTLKKLSVEADKHTYYDFTRAGDDEPPGTVFEGEPPPNASAPPAEQPDGDVSMLFPQLGEPSALPSPQISSERPPRRSANARIITEARVARESRVRHPGVSVAQIPGGSTPSREPDSEATEELYSQTSPAPSEPRDVPMDPPADDPEQNRY